MNHFKKLSAIVALAIASLGAPAYADIILTGDDAAFTSVDFCDFTGTSMILTCLAGEVTLGNEVYKDDMGDGEEGILAGSYETTYSNDDHDFVITYTGGDIATGDPLWLFVKDGNHVPKWYLFDLAALGWDGVMTITGTCLWGTIENMECTTGMGSISHLSIFSETTRVPEPGTLALLGLGLLGMGAARRRRKTA